MTIIAFTRFSTSTQNADGQRDRIKKYCQENKLAISKWKEIDSVSASKTTAEERGWYELIESLKEGDTVITTEVSRISRDPDPAEIMFSIQSALRKGITIIFTDNRTYQILKKGDMGDPGRLFMVAAESYVASEYSKQRKIKTQAAIKRRKQAGLHNGRPHGIKVASKLDQHEDTIIRLLAQGVSKTAIAKELSTPYSSLIFWLNKRDEIRAEAEKSDISTLLTLSEIKTELNHFNSAATA